LREHIGRSAFAERATERELKKPAVTIPMTAGKLAALSVHDFRLQPALDAKDAGGTVTNRHRFRLWKSDALRSYDVRPAGKTGNALFE
jgi:hypothetical protein